jgi:hypothetical protein
MIELFRLAAQLQSVCVAKEWRFCFIGGIAVQRWGVPRVTRDVDMTLLTGFGGESRYIESLLQLFLPRIDEAGEFARDHRVLLLQSDEGIGIDISLAALPFEELAVERSTIFEFLPGVDLQTCSAEDLIVMKAFADRGRDWVDVENVAARQGSRLDWPYIERQLSPLAELKDSPGIMERIRAIQGS